MHKIIIVDDNKVIANTLKLRINYLFPDIEICGVFNNAADTLNFMQHGTDYIVVTDISMPEMDGLQMTEKIKSTGLNAQIIIITGYEKLEYFKWAIENQVVAFILKPIEDEALFNAINSSVERLKSQNSLCELSSTIEAIKVKELFLKKFTELTALFKSMTLENYNEIAKAINKMNYGEMDDITIYCITPCSALQVAEVEQNLLLKILRENQNNKAYEKHLYINNNIILVNKFADDNEFKGVNSTILDFLQENKLSYKIARGEQGHEVAKNISTLVCKLHNECYNTEFSFIESDYTYDEQINSLISRIKLLLSLNLFDEAINLFVNSLKSYSANTSIYSMNIVYSKFCATLIEFQSDAAYDLKYTSELMFPLLAYSGWEDLKERLLMVSAKCRKTQKNVGHTVVSYINENFTSPVSLNTLAKKVYLHPNYLGQLIKEETGSTFNDYLNNLRVAHAKEILRSNSDIKLGELSVHLGYSDNKYFSKVFKKITGFSPSNYIKLS